MTGSEPMIYDLIIIGAGPGGLMAAVEAGRKGFTVLLLEKNNRPGKKLLVTGSGQCNLTNDLPLQEFLKHYHDKSRTAGKTIRQFPPEALIKWFETVGVPMETTFSGKVFPKSRKASDVLQALLRQAEASAVKLICDTRVISMQHTCTGFIINTAEHSFNSKQVLIATGGCSYPSLGTTGDGFKLAASLGHRIIPPRPSLAAVQISDYLMADLAGLTISPSYLTLWREERKMADYTGDLLMTHSGLSGPVILNHSRDFQSSDILTLNLAAPYNEEKFAVFLLEKLNESGKRQVRTAMMNDMIPKRLIEKMLSMAEIPEALTSSQLSKEQRRRIVRLMTQMPFRIKNVAGYDEAMATAGGIDTEEINAVTMESRIVPGLYFAGEVIDIDGMTGGFNLQFAFSSGFAAAHALKKRR
jgi:predicted Rossmann fold flavoprotein